MSTGSEREMTHADRHDLDKLARWKAGLDGAEDGGASGFPACAIFLVTGEDRASHDIFRRYRSTFEDLGGGFHHLVIFGQHGASTTQAAFLRQLAADPQAVPLLALAPMSRDSDTAYCIELPMGDRDGDLDETQTWATALDAVKASVENATDLYLLGVEGVHRAELAAGSLRATVIGVFRDLNSET